jgi:hypothetical protein
MPGNCLFQTWVFLHAPGQLLLPSLYSIDTRSPSGDRQRGLTSDLASSEVSPGGGGNPVESLLMPLDPAGSSGQYTVLRHVHCATCTDNSLACIYIAGHQ